MPTSVRCGCGKTLVVELEPGEPFDCPACGRGHHAPAAEKPSEKPREPEPKPKPAEVRPAEPKEPAPALKPAAVAAAPKPEPMRVVIVDIDIPVNAIVRILLTWTLTALPLAVFIGYAVTLVWVAVRGH